MRKIVFFIFVLMLTSCSTQQAKDILTKLFFNNKEEIATNISNEENPITDISFKKTTWCDSVKLQRQLCKITYSCEYPQNDGSVATQNIQYWICEKFGDKNHKYYNNIPKLLSTKGKEVLNSIKKFPENDYSSGDGWSSWTSEISIKRIFGNDTCVTLSLHWEEVRAEEEEIITFDKRTGHQYGFDLLDKYNKTSLNRLLVDSFKKYYKTTSDEDFLSTEEFIKIKEIIKTLNIDDISLPSTTPYILRDSIVLIYKPYEFKKLSNTPRLMIPLDNSNSVACNIYKNEIISFYSGLKGLPLDVCWPEKFYDDNKNVIFTNPIYRATDTILLSFEIILGKIKGDWCRLDDIKFLEAEWIRKVDGGYSFVDEEGHSYDIDDFYENFSLPKSPTGNYWLPTSEIPELTTIGDGGVWFCLREEPNFASKINYSSFKYTSFEVLDLKEGWVKVGIIEYLPDEEGRYSIRSKKNIEGWIPIVHTCSNPYTVCC